MRILLNLTTRLIALGVIALGAAPMAFANPELCGDLRVIKQWASMPATSLGDNQLVRVSLTRLFVQVLDSSEIVAGSKHLANAIRNCPDATYLESLQEVLSGRNNSEAAQAIRTLANQGSFIADKTAKLGGVLVVGGIVIFGAGVSSNSLEGLFTGIMIGGLTGGAGLAITTGSLACKYLPHYISRVFRNYSDPDRHQRHLKNAVELADETIGARSNQIKQGIVCQR